MTEKVLFVQTLNKMLNEEYKIRNVKFDGENSTDDFYKAYGINWDDLVFPHVGSIGVYFLFGKSRKDKYGVYIGKASFSRRIGNRLWDHLTNYRDEMNYQKDDKNGDTYYIEWIGALNLDNICEGFFAASMEEYLIRELKPKFHLINKVGN
jgi:hypothetical protein